MSFFRNPAFMGSLLPASTAQAATHATALAWASRVVSNGGASPSAATVAAISSFCSGLDAAGLTSKVPSMNCFAPDSLIAAITPLLIPAGGGQIWTNSNFVDADLNVNGLKGNGSSKYLSPQFTFAGSGFAASGSVSVIVYQVDVANTSGTYAGAATTIGRMRCGWDSSLGDYFCCWADVSTFGTGQNTALFKGYMCASKTTTTRRDIYHASSTVTHASIANNTSLDGAGTDLPSNNQLAVFCSDEATTPTGFTTGRFSFVGFGSGLSAADSLSLYGLIQALRTALGGGYI